MGTVGYSFGALQEDAPSQASHAREHDISGSLPQAPEDARRTRARILAAEEHDGWLSKVHRPTRLYVPDLPVQQLLQQRLRQKLISPPHRWVRVMILLFQ